MSTRSFERTFVISDENDIEQLIEVMEAEPHPIDTSRHSEIKAAMERGEALLKKLLFR